MTEPKSDTVNVPQLLWNNLTELRQGESVTSLNSTNKAETVWVPDFLHVIVIIVIVIFISLCGLVGNGIVIWLLGFSIRRNSFSVYILNLAVADFTYLLGYILEVCFILSNCYIYFFPGAIVLPSYMAGLSLLMAISIERCISVLWPIWYKCHRPTHLSTIVCVLIWLLGISFAIIVFLCKNVRVRHNMHPSLFIISIITLTVLCVCSLTLLIRVHCYSRRKHPSKLYWTILLNVLAILLFCVPPIVSILNPPQVLGNDIKWVLLFSLCAVNKSINPIIYFFAGQHEQHGDRKPFREVLQSVMKNQGLNSEEEESTIPRQSMATPEHQKGDLC